MHLNLTRMETMTDKQVLIDGKQVTITYRSTQEGDEVVVLANGVGENYTYEASISDADELNWIVVK